MNFYHMTNTAIKCEDHIMATIHQSQHILCLSVVRHGDLEL